MPKEGSEPGVIDLTELILTGQHPVLRIGAEQHMLSQHVLARSVELHPNGLPLALDVEVDRLRSSIGLDGTGRVAYWVLKQSLQNHALHFTTSSGTFDLAGIDAFEFLRLLEAARIPYAREIWRNSVCVITVLQSDVTVSFDLEPAVARTFASIERATVPLYLGGDVFRRTDYG